MKDLIYGYFTAANEQPNFRRKSGYDVQTGYVCVLIKRPPIDSDSTEYEASFSFCSPNDQFVKRISRTIANGRMESGKTIKFNFVKEGTNPKPIFEHAMTLALKLGDDIRSLETPFSHDKVEIYRTTFAHTTKKPFSPRWLLTSMVKYGINREQAFVRFGEKVPMKSLNVVA